MPEPEELSITNSPQETASRSAADAWSLLDGLPDGVLLMDRAWRIVYANTVGRRISRLEPGDFNSRTHWEIYPTTIGTEAERVYRRVMAERVEEDFTFFYPPFQVWFQIRVKPVEVGIALYYQDVTELRRVQAKTDSLAEQLEQVFDATTDAIGSLNREWQYTYLNPRARQMLGEGLLGRNIWHVFPEAVYPGSPYVENYYKTMVDRVPTRFEASYPDPLNITMRLEALPSKDGIVVFFRDITEERRDKEALLQSEARYRVLAELSPQAIWTATANGDIDYANQRFLDYIGHHFSPQDGSEWVGAFADEDRDRVIAAWIHSVKTGEDYCVEARLIRYLDGAERWWDVRASAVRNADGKITGWLGAASDIHDRKMAAEQLRQQQAQTEQQRAELQAVYQTAPVGLALFEPKEFRYLRVNDRQCEILGNSPEELIGRRIDEIVASPVVPTLFREKVLKGETVRDYIYETELVARPGEVRFFNVNYSPVFDEDGSVRAISAAVLEVTQLHKAQKALMQSEKLAAVGRLASSISHEINNPLEAVTNLLYLVAMDETLSPQLKPFVHSAQDELARVSQIATQTLRFHRQANKPTLVTAAQLVDAVLNLFQGRLSNSRIHVEASYSTATQVLCFENDIRQVLNNLIANAIDAMRTGGRLLVRAHDAKHRSSGVPGIRIIVADTGTGMSAETQQRLYEAFYTTKDLNGTGLGMWISKEIIDRHRGTLIVRSTQEAEFHGTVFSLFLPCE